MNGRAKRFAWVALAVGLAAAAPGAAQDVGIYEEGPAAAPGVDAPAARGRAQSFSVGVTGLGGEDFEGIAPGYTFGYYILRPIGPAFRLGLGVDLGLHSLEDDPSQPLYQYGASLEARLNLAGRRARLVPVIGARFGVAQQAISDEGSMATNVGFASMGLAGVELFLGEGAALELLGVFGQLSFGDFTVRGEDGAGTVPESATTGGSSSFVLALKLY